MSPPYVRSEDTSSSSGFGPQGWLTPTQREHSANYIGSDKSRVIADVIRDREVLGSDGIVRERPEVSLSYRQALEYLGMGNDSVP